jgi:guanylate kinase
VMPPDEDELAARLRGRGTDSDEVIALRLRNAIDEMRHWPEYRYRLLSGTPEQDYAKFKALLFGERLRVSRLK